ncbi:ADP-forming succinate--CoA ligase subunit beta, partial [candidate division KSB1 bacterium]|nr:ADP-forming succinate--CoA ligase subunit beta [candidate division KSB1 bacterium]
MNIHEHQGKELLRALNVTTPRGKVAYTADEAYETAKELGTPVVVVKAQIHAGGRGKGGGVKLAKSPEEAKRIASEMLGMTLVTHQTGPEGRVVHRVLVEEGMDIKQELYLGIVLDRETSRLVFMASTEGGVEIEKVAAESPEKILKAYIDPAVGFAPFQARNLAFGLGLQGDSLKKVIQFMQSLYKAFINLDASIAEINPLVITGSGDVIALDAKINIDDNALYRHPDIKELRDVNEEAPLEVEASKFGLNYIKLDGNVGCMVNGAGLAMATMDLIKIAGASPANFLDVGGVANV